MRRTPWYNCRCRASTPTSTTSVVWPADVVRDAVNHELVHSGDTDVVEVLHRLLDRQRHLHHCQRLLHEAIEEALRWVRLPRHGEALNANIHERNIWSTIVAEARFGSAASSSGTRTWVNSQVALLLPDLPRDVANLRHALPGEADDTEAGFRRRAWRTHATNLYQKEGRPMPRGRWPSEDDRDLYLVQGADDVATGNWPQNELLPRHPREGRFTAPWKKTWTIRVPCTAACTARHQLAA